MDITLSDIIEVNDYFEKIINMIPDNELRQKAAKRKKRPHSNKHSDNNNPSKKTKLNPHHLKAIQELNNYMSEDDENDSYVNKSKQKTWFADRSKCSIEELHNRLQKKIEEIRLQREKKAIKKQRTRNSKNFLNLGKKTKTSAVIENDLQSNKPVVEKSQNSSDALSTKSQSHSDALMAKSQNGSDSLVTKEGKVVFSKFDFSQMVGTMSSTKSSKKRKLPTGKNYELLLLKANKEKEKLEKLKQQDPKKAEKVIEKKSWAKAVAKAEGTKIKDDPELLKKSLKRKLSKKKQSAKQWQERNEKLQEKMQRKQDRRNANLQKRKEHKKNKKAFKRAKKMPGF